MKTLGIAGVPVGGRAFGEVHRASHLPDGDVVCERDFHLRPHAPPDEVLIV